LSISQMRRIQRVGWTSLKEAEVSSRFFLVFGRGQRVPLSGTAEAVISKLMKVLC